MLLGEGLCRKGSLRTNSENFPTPRPLTVFYLPSPLLLLLTPPLPPVSIDLYIMRQWACSCVSTAQPCSMNTTAFTGPANETGYDITTLNINEWTEGVTETEYDQAYYKFNFQPTADIPCPMLHIDKETETGTLSAFINIGSIPSANDRTWYAPYFGYSTISICPMHPSFTYGWYYITLVNQRSSAYNSYRLRFRVQNSPSCIAPVATPSNLPSGHVYLEDGIPIENTLDYPELDYYVFKAQATCTNLSVSINKILPEGDLDLYVSWNNPRPQFDDPDSHTWHSTVDGDDRVNIHFCHPDGTTHPTFYFGVRAAATGTATYKIVATVLQWADPIPITDLAYFQTRMEMSYGSALYLNCSQGQVFTCGFPTYQGCFNDGFQCCYRYTPIVPSDVTTALWPWSEAGDLSIGDLAMTIPWHDTLPGRSGKLAWSLLLSEATPDTYTQYANTTGSLGGVIGTTLGECKITLGNAIVSRTTTPIVPSVLEFTQKTFNCTNAAYETAKTAVDEFSDTLTDAETLPTLALQQLRLAIASNHPAMLGCSQFVRNLSTTGESSESYAATTQCEDTPGTDSWAADPCCNLALDQCCAPRAIFFARTAPVDIAESTITSSCKTPECSKAGVQSWIDAVNNAANLTSGCERIIDDTASLASITSVSSFINDCRVSIMADDLFGRTCTKDSDCLTSAGRTCNLTTLRCNHQDSDVVACLVTNMPEMVQRLLYNSWNMTAEISPTELTDEINSRFFQSQCSGYTARRYIPGYHWDPQVVGCADQCSADGADPFCFDRSCEVPAYCDGSNANGACYRFWGPVVQDDAGCVEDEICNWKRCLHSEANYDDCLATCANSSSVCIQCNGAYCLEVDGITTKTACDAGSTGATSNCASSGSCSVSCSTCNTESGCTSHAYCSDSEELATYVSQGGYCVFTPSYSSGSAWACDNANHTLYSAGCVSSDADAATCGTNSGTWTTFATNSATCSSIAHGCYSTTSGARSWSYDQSTCEDCSGMAWLPVYNYTAGATWSTGYLQNLIWTTRATIPANVLKNTLSYTQVMTAVSEASTAQTAYSYRTHALCRLDSAMRLVSSAICDCNDANAASGSKSKCFGSVSDLQVGTGLGCPYLESSIETTVGDLQLASNSYPQVLCSSIGIFYTSASQYELPTTFSQAVFRQDVVNSFWIVKNSDTANVGQIVSGAVRVELTDAFENDALLCIEPDTSLSVDSSATVWTLAKTDSDDDVQVFLPKGTSTTITTMTVDGKTILSTNGAIYNTTTQRVCGPIRDSGTYFAARVIPKWESTRLQTASQEAQSIAAATLFAIVAAFAIIQAALLFSNRDEERILSLKMIFIGIIFLNCVIRAAYVLLPSNTFTTKLAAAEFTVFELPTFLFFSVFTSIIYLWLLVVAKTGVLGNRKAMKTRRALMLRVLVIGNLTMYFFVILFIILIAILPRLAKSAPCFLGNANADASGNNVSYKIKLAYWIFEFVVSVTVALAFLISALLLLRLMLRSSKALKRSRKYSTPVLIITSVAIICSIGLIIRNSVFLWAASTGNTVNVLVFAFLEIIPQAFLLFYLHPFRVFREASTSTHNSKSGTEMGSKTGTSGTYGSKGSQEYYSSEAPARPQSNPRGKAGVPLDTSTYSPPSSPISKRKSVNAPSTKPTDTAPAAVPVTATTPERTQRKKVAIAGDESNGSGAPKRTRRPKEPKETPKAKNPPGMRAFHDDDEEDLY